MKTILITGANRGLGFELTKQLALKGNHVLMTGRNIEALEKGRRELLKLDPSLSLEIMKLDLEDSASFPGFCQELKQKHNSLDVLIHNAAILNNVDRQGSILSLDESLIRKTMEINALGPMILTQHLLPLLKNGSRIVNISARPALFRNLINSPRFPAYRLSKLLFHGWSVIMARELQEKGIVVVNMHPGWIRTDMGGQNASLSVEEGADTAVWLSLEAPDEVHGKFYMERKPLDW